MALFDIQHTKSTKDHTATIATLPNPDTKYTDSLLIDQE
jgi:hypothetical protein